MSSRLMVFVGLCALLSGCSREPLHKRSGMAAKTPPPNTVPTSTVTTPAAKPLKSKSTVAQLPTGLGLGGAPSIDAGSDVNAINPVKLDTSATLGGAAVTGL